MTAVPIRTRWIDERGGDGDLLARVGRLGNDVRIFALHTLGWARIQDIKSYREIEFDPQAVGRKTIETVLRVVQQFEGDPSRALLKASAYTGNSWISQSATGGEIDTLLQWISSVAEFGREQTVPTALSVTDMGDAAIAGDCDPVLRAIVGAWQETGGRLDWSGSSPWVTMPWGGPRPASNVKILQRDADGEIVFSAYQPSLTALWEPTTFGRFVHSRVLERVPDRALAQRVVRSAVRTLSSGAPRAERFVGPCLRSDGSVVDLDWMRVSLPAKSISSTDFDSVIVFCRRFTEEERRRVSG